MPSETKSILTKYFLYKRYLKTIFNISAIISMLILINNSNNYKIIQLLFSIESLIIIVLFGLSIYFTSRISKILASTDLTSYKRDIKALEHFKLELINIKEEITIRENELNKIIDSAPDNHKNLFKNDGKLVYLEEKAQNVKDEILFLEDLSKYIKKD